MTNTQFRYLDLLKKALTASLYDESAWAIIETQTRRRPTFRHPLRWLRTLIRNRFVQFLRDRGLLLVRYKPFDAELRRVGRDWPMVGYTMIGHARLDNIQMCVEDVLKAGVEGDFIETGVWRGGSVIFMRALLEAYAVTDRIVWAADSFQGLPVPQFKGDGNDLSRVDFLKVSRSSVLSNFERFGLADGQVRFLEGWFRDTLHAAPIDKLAILRLDGDLYSSTMESLQALYHKVSVGGYVIVDDYYSWPGCRKAVSDFFAERGAEPEILPIDWTGAYWKVR